MSDIILFPERSSVVLDVNATVDGWLTRTVNADSPRMIDMKNDKSKAVFHFFDWIKKSPEQVLPKDVQDWLEVLKKQKLSVGTRYNRVSSLAGYYEYLRLDVGLIKQIPINPAQVSRIKAPDPFQSESVKALTADELFSLLSVVEKHAATKRPVFMRDYAILQMYVMTGKRREEIIQLKGSSIEIKQGRFFIRSKLKGGKYVTFEMNDATAQNALYDYLYATERGPEIFGLDRPLWLRHSTGGKPTIGTTDGVTGLTRELSSHGFAKRMKIYALEAELKGFHIHKLRHTFASILADSVESMADTQEALGHSNIKTTQVYVKRLKVRRDKSSAFIRRTLDIEAGKSKGEK